VKAFTFHRDGLFLTGCLAYALNRFFLKPALDLPFLHSHFNDLWLIPCALPLVLWIHRKLGWRGDGFPTLAEICGHLLIWSLLFEGVGPRLVAHTTADPLDVVWYWIGGFAGWLWWHRAALRLRALTT